MCSEGKTGFVMGGGKFGTHALRHLKAKGAKVLVVNVNLDCMAKSEIDLQVVGLGASDSLADGQTAFFVDDAVDLLATLP